MFINNLEAAPIITLFIQTRLMEAVIFSLFCSFFFFFFLTFLDHFFSWTKGIKLTCLRLSKRWLKGHTKKAKKILSRITKRKKSCVDYHLLSLQFHWNLETCSKKSIPDYHLAYSHPFAVIMYSYLILTKITC